MENIVFLTKEEAKRLIDESPSNTIAMMVTEIDGTGKPLEKVCKEHSKNLVDSAAFICCCVEEIFANMSLYQTIRTDATYIPRNNEPVTTLMFKQKTVS